MTSLSSFIHRKFVVLRQDTPVVQAARILCENQIGALLVGDSQGNAVGIVTDRDFACRWGVAHEEKDLPIEKIMSRDLAVADEGGGLTTVIELMERHGVRRIPIVRTQSDGRRSFVGIVTLDDLIATRQIAPSQLARIIRRQVGRRIENLLVHTPETARAQSRAEARKKHAADQFISQIARATDLSGEMAAQVAQFILGALIMRVSYTATRHFLAQLPERVREPLFKLPPGPNRELTSERVLHELCSRFSLKRERARVLMHQFFFALHTSKEWQAVRHLEAQLPEDFKPYFEGIGVERSQRGEPGEEERPNPEPEQASEVEAGDPPESPWEFSRSFASREEAADLLASRLESYQEAHPLVLGIPRGSVPMAKIIAKRLKGDLDVVLVHKIGAPGNPEFAIGSVSEFGDICRSEAIEFYEISSETLEKTSKAEIERLKKRRESYSPIRPPISPSGRTVIIVDDGIATGSTMLAAIRAIRAQKAKRIVVAAPVASPRAVDSLKQAADEVVVLEAPEEFFSISQFYDDFPQVEDEEVLEALSGAEGPPRRKTGKAA